MKILMAVVHTLVFSFLLFIANYPATVWVLSSFMWCMGYFYLLDKSND